ncbi:MAG: YceI family protein, partial [Chloroflexi bacterium]|nr:YceI family protein [Chloroflexota bacterium]
MFLPRLKFPKLTVLAAVALTLTALLTACGPLANTEQRSTSTTAPTTAPTTAVQPTAASAPASTSTSAATRAPAATSAPTTTTSSVQTVRLEIVSGDTEARYRVREQLARLSFPSDAIGATKSVTGTIVAHADGTIDTSQSKFQVDLSTLKSDEGQRDNFIKQNTLQTNRFKYAVFVPTKIEGLQLPPPTSGDVSFKLIGDLTIRDVTKQVTWDVKGTVSGDDAKGLATTSFTFADFNLSKPSVFTVLSLEDTIKLEL